MTPVIATHIASASLGLGLLPGLALVRRGTLLHRVLGWVWSVALVATCVSSFWIHTFDLWLGLSPIHILSVWTLAALLYALWCIRRGRVTEHRRTMLGITSGLLIAFLLTLWPGRIIGDALWGLF